MAIKKIPCGGWLYDDEQITFEDGVMKVIGGGGISEAPIDGKQYARKDAEWSEVQSGGGGGVMVVEFTTDGENISANKTVEEAKVAMSAGQVVTGILKTGESIQPLGVCGFDVTSNNIGFVAFIYNGALSYFFVSDDDNWTLGGA